LPISEFIRVLQLVAACCDYQKKNWKERVKLTFSATTGGLARVQNIERPTSNIER